MRLIAKRKEWDLMAEHAWHSKPSPVSLPSAGTPTLYLIRPMYHYILLKIVFPPLSTISALKYNIRLLTLHDVFFQLDYLD